MKPPKAVAGFDFGAGPTEAENTCEGATKIWTSSSSKLGRCSGPATDVGFDVTVRVDFCHKQVCAITLEHRPESNWITAFGALKQKLSDKYGTPATTATEGIPEKCRKEEQFAQCLEDDGLRLGFRWEWPTKQQIDLTIGRPEKEEGPVAIRIKYVSPQKRLRTTSDAL